MKTNKRVEYSNFSDQALLNLFEQCRDRMALSELHERYRKPIGQFLYRKIKDKRAIGSVFNSILMELISDSTASSAQSDVATRMFAIAYKLRADYINRLDLDDTANIDQSAQVATGAKTNNNAGDDLKTLPKTHKDVLELVYQHDFSFDQTAAILGCSTTVVRDRWSEAKSIHVQT